jgi:hypothetical protein
MPLIIAALLGLTAALIAAYPLLGLSRERREAASPARLSEFSEVSDRERQARQALREVELDYTLGNLESGDYDALRGRYERRALAALRARYQREQELDAQIERDLDALRAGQRPAAPIAPSAPAAKATPAAKVMPDTGAKPATPRATRPVAARRAPRQKGGR